LSYFKASCKVIFSRFDVFAPIYITVHMHVYSTQTNNTAQLQLIKYPHKLSYEHNSKTDIHTQNYACY